VLPSTTQTLVGHGHTVLVQKNAGVGTGYPDEEYVKAGAQIVESAEEIFQRADMIVKVKEPLPAEWPLLRRGQILFTYLHLAASKPLTEALLKSGVIGVAYETIQIGNRLPLLEPMSEIAGRMSVVMGAYYLAKHNGGTGVLLGGVPGVLPGRVVVLGGGTAGTSARIDGDDRSAYRRGPGARSESAEINYASDVAKNETGQCSGGHCDRSGRLRRNVAANNAPRSRLCRGRRHPLLRSQHAGCLCADRYPGADEYYRPLRRVAG